MLVFGRFSADECIGDENPEWTANRLLSFFAKDEGIPSVDLSYLKNKITLVESRRVGL